MEFRIQPVVTEKANRLTENDNRYTFRVSPEANKYQIKELVESLYNVKVSDVNTMVVRGKNKRRYTKTCIVKGKTPQWKKAIVTLAQGSSIDFYSNI
ncbi:MAG: 50S ribosomal protein L23 [Muribaculaceae bacterium]|nr:50S ribosomal protein L23 [Muribaculaceae bacterium]